MKAKIILSVALLIATVNSGWACTNMIVGKNASADGSVIVSYSADSYGMYGFLCSYPAATHSPEDKRPIHEWDTGKYLGEIDEVRTTYNVIGNINEHQVTIAETTFGGREELIDTTGVMDYGSLIYVALQRSRTAKEAIEIMTNLVKEYGYCSSGESFTVADPTEAWILEMIGKGPGVRGAVWVAVRVPDDCIAGHANQARIRKFDLNDKANCLYSPDVISFAREKGYFTGKNTDFSFAEAYCPLDFGGLRYCEARVWSFYNMFCKNMDSYLSYIYGESNEAMPLFIKPDRKISVRDIQLAMRDHYEGTPLDITQDLGAGPYAMPYRPSPLSFQVDEKEYFNERPISTQQSAFVFVSQMRSHMYNPIGGVLWFGTDDANMAVYTPVYCCTSTVPECYAEETADAVTFSWASSFWIFNWVANMVYPRYSLMIEDVRAQQNALEENFLTMQKGIEQQATELYNEDPMKARIFLNEYSGKCAEETLKKWRKLGEYLIVRYNDMVVKRINDDGTFTRTKTGHCAPLIRPGYPEQFNEKVVKESEERYEIKN